MPAIVSRRSIQAGLLALVFASAPAWAQTRVTEVRVHGTSCTLQQGSAGKPQWSSVGLMNMDLKGTGSMVILCAVPRSTYQTATIGGGSCSVMPNATVDLIDGNSTIDIGCNLLVLNEANAITTRVFTHSVGFSSDSRSQPVPFPLGKITLQPSDRLAVECVIPSASNSGALPSGIVGISIPVCETAP
jgi:hypothetical protein